MVRRIALIMILVVASTMRAGVVGLDRISLSAGASYSRTVGLFIEPNLLWRPTGGIGLMGHVGRVPLLVQFGYVAKGFRTTVVKTIATAGGPQYVGEIHLDDTWHCLSVGVGPAFGVEGSRLEFRLPVALRGHFLAARMVDQFDGDPEDQRAGTTPASLGIDAGPLLGVRVGRLKLSLQYIVSIDLSATNVSTGVPNGVEPRVRHFVYSLQLALWFPLHRQASGEAAVGDFESDGSTRQW